MKKHELKQLAVRYEEALVGLILLGKISISDIPYKYRRFSFDIYVASYQASQHDEQKRAAYLKLLFKEYDYLLKSKKHLLRDSIRTTMYWDRAIIRKYNIAPPRDYLAGG